MRAVCSAAEPPPAPSYGGAFFVGLWLIVDGRLAQHARHRSGLDELRAVPDDRDYPHVLMGRKLIGGAVGAVSIAAEAVKHVVWYVNHQVSGRPRDKGER